MILINDPLRQTDLPRGCVATIGNFDGMHIGHQAIIRGVVERARETGRPSAVITFHPHPLSIVAPDRVPKQILTLSQKEELIRNMGIDALLVVPFTHEFSRWTADRFIGEFLVAALQVTNVGVRPTLYENYGITIESHILDFDSNVYGDTVRLYFHALLRREQQFRSAVELTRQIRDDIERSRRYFLRHPIQQ